MTIVKSLVAASVLSAFAVASFAQSPAAPVSPLASKHAVERHHHKHHHHHRHHAPVRR